MDKDYQHLEFQYRRSPDQDLSRPAHHPVVVAGAGPVGLATAIDLAQRGIKVVLLDDDNKLSFGSRAICFAKRTLEIFDRLGCGQRIVEKGISWNIGKVFFHEDLAYTFNLLPETGHRRPAFINLQQYYLEGYLVEHAETLENLNIRWRNKVIGLTHQPDGVEVTVETPDGPYNLRCEYLVACDGGRSPIRGMMGLESKGVVFRDRFLIADVKMTADFPTERWFWFDPPFHRNQSVLLHRQPDNVWRVDFQLGWDADPEEEKKPERVIPRIQALLGKETDFTLEWVSVYTFVCRRMEKFRHGRVIFAGDSAHGVSPFGARGANSGVQDADNLAWKLQLVLEGKAPASLLDTYGHEREYAADENILNSTRSTDFITPKSEISRVFRDATLHLAKDHAFARRLVNSGRLSVPAVLHGSPLNTPDQESFAGGMVPGSPSADAPVQAGRREDWFLSHVGPSFTGVHFADGPALGTDVVSALGKLAQGAIGVKPIVVMPRQTEIAPLPGIDIIDDAEGVLAQRFDARPGTYYLFRPDQHVCARWRRLDPLRVQGAVARATGNA